VTALLLKSSLSFSLIGSWVFDEVIYRGERAPRPNEDLKLCAEYDDEGKSHLIWFREGEDGFCERWGTYKFADGQLIDQITRVNQKNAAECATDPDMQPDKVTETPVELVSEDEMHMTLRLGDEDLIYIWKRMDQCPVQRQR
jgi:hypothetical protein